MTPSFAITIEPRRKLMRITLEGFFALENVAELVAEKALALARLGCARNQHYTLVDVSACKLQPQNVVIAFQTALADPRVMSKRIAFVTGSSLARMQVRRMIARDDADFFDSVTAAEVWLFAEEPMRLSARG
jgi:hypothetical protein